MLRNSLNYWNNIINSTSPQLLLIYTFAFLIALGTGLLLLPAVQNTDISFLDAFFTATSATCVTGLATIDIGTSFNFYGQLIILALIQLGGVGLMTFAAISFAILGARISLGTMDVLDDTLAIRSPASKFIHTFKLMFFMILSIEIIGACFIFVGLVENNSILHSIWNALFLSISAFCNAGFTLYGDSLASVSDFTRVFIVILIILGGLGHLVLAEIFDFCKHLLSVKRIVKPRLFSLHVRIVLLTSAVLLIFGCLSTYLLNMNNDHIGWFESFFQSVTARTAGFSTVDQTAFSLPSILILILLMLVGGSAGSCAGGLKITTLAVWLANVRSILRGRNEVTLLSMKVPLNVISKVTKIIALALVWNIIGLVLLTIFEEQVPLDKLLFEEISAFATVGLSLDLTPHLSEISQLWIILTMFVGRLGTLTIALALPRSQPLNISHPEGRILVG